MHTSALELLHLLFPLHRMFLLWVFIWHTPSAPSGLSKMQSSLHLWHSVSPLPRGFPGGTVVNNPPVNAGDTRCGLDPWVRKISWRRKWQATPVFLPGKFHGQKSQEGYNPWSCKELDMTECACTRAHTHTHTHTHTNTHISITCFIFHLSTYCCL